MPSPPSNKADPTGQCGAPKLARLPLTEWPYRILNRIIFSRPPFVNMNKVPLRSDHAAPPPTAWNSTAVSVNRAACACISAWSA